jgi:hypothetical protein
MASSLTFVLNGMIILSRGIKEVWEPWTQKDVMNAIFVKLIIVACLLGDSNLQHLLRF